ncbi:MAG: hypothetical protein ACKOEZ_06365, partial [Spartobacteria bacterium]
MEIQPITYLLAAALVAFASLIQGIAGFAFGLICVPFLSILFSTQTKRIMNTTSDRGRWPRPNHLAPAALAVAAILMTGPLVAQSEGDNLLKNGDAEAGTAET